MKTVLLRFAVRTLASLPSSCEQGREREGQGSGSCCRRQAQPSRPVPTSGAKTAGGARSCPYPTGAPRLAFLPSAVQLWSLDLASRWRGGDKRTWGRGQDTGGGKGQRGFPAGTAGQGAAPGRGLMAPRHPEASFTGASSKPPASCLGCPRPRSQPTAPRNPSGSLLLRWCERRSSDLLGADLWLTPPPLERFLPPDPVCTEHPGPREEPGSRHWFQPHPVRQDHLCARRPTSPAPAAPGHTRWMPGS